MEGFEIKDFTFAYPDRDTPAIRDINLSVKQGEFLVICGASGSGKTTLVRNLKPSLAPKGSKQGNITLGGVDLSAMPAEEEASRIGYVLQNPDNQIVTDKVWHELAFGAESLGWDENKMRRRVAEMASYFNLESLFHRNTHELSGGQKQTLNLASIMAMDPEILILDEPTAQLDPIGADDFLETVYRINKELGKTVILTEHRLDKVIPMADKLAVMEEGRLIAVDEPRKVGAFLIDRVHKMVTAMPIPFQAYALTTTSQRLSSHTAVEKEAAPMDVQQGRLWLSDVADKLKIDTSERPALPSGGQAVNAEEVISMKEVWFRYGKHEQDVLKNLNLSVNKGEVLAILGGNGSGKTTVLKVLSGIKDSYRGRTKIFGKNVEALRKEGELYSGLIGVVPQNPQTVFSSESVYEELEEMVGRVGDMPDEAEKEAQIQGAAAKVGVEHLLQFHPYDLSGGEQQRVALAKVLLLQPQIILLDEPTKGIDNFFKEEFARLIDELASEGKTVIMVSHDVEYCARHADRCALLFDGSITTMGRPREFFSGNSHYTTSGNKMSRQVFENAITAEDIYELLMQAVDGDNNGAGKGSSAERQEDSNEDQIDGDCESVPLKSTGEEPERKVSSKGVLKRMALPILATLAFFVSLYVTASMGGDRTNLLVSVLVVFAIMVPFFVMFEKRRPSSYEVVLIAVMVTLAVVGRLLFVALPNIKPVFAIVIIAGAFLGPSRGFVIGSMTAFVSNFIFGQGPWTPYQMLAWGIMGFVAGLLGEKLLYKKYPIAISVYGFIASFIFHGLITDVWTILSISNEITWGSLLAVYGAALPVNLMLGISTVIFLWILTNPIVRKLDRLNKKWDIVTE